MYLSVALILHWWLWLGYTFSAFHCLLGGNRMFLLVTPYSSIAPKRKSILKMNDSDISPYFIILQCTAL